MKFHWTFVKTSSSEESATRTIEVNHKICGLQLRNSRPHTVELTGAELQYLLQNPKYAVGVVLKALAHENKTYDNKEERQELEATD